MSAVTRLRKVVSPRVGEKIRGNCVSVAWKWETCERGRRRGRRGESGNEKRGEERRGNAWKEYIKLESMKTATGNA